MPGAPSVRPLVRADIPWAIALTDAEGWGYTPADFDRIQYLGPQGVFVGEADGERVGLIAAITYGPLAYIGAVIVDARWRGKHVGETLMRAALGFCDGRAAETVRLNAYLNVVPFYERLGFRTEFENHRYTGRHEGRVAPGVRPMRSDDLAAIEELDAPFFGADRGRLLTRLLEEFPATSLVVDDGGEIVAFAFGNSGAGSCEIGPFVCSPERASEAEDLLHTMLAAADKPCAFSLPAVNEKGVAAARRAGFRETFRTMRMYRGSPAHGGDTRGIFALAGLEKG